MPSNSATTARITTTHVKLTAFCCSSGLVILNIVSPPIPVVFVLTERSVPDEKMNDPKFRVLGEHGVCHPSQIRLSYLFVVRVRVSTANYCFDSVDLFFPMI
jgi:hypothetical protein